MGVLFDARAAPGVHVLVRRPLLLPRERADVEVRGLDRVLYDVYLSVGSFRRYRYRQILDAEEVSLANTVRDSH